MRILSAGLAARLPWKRSSEQDMASSRTASRTASRTPTSAPARPKRRCKMPGWLQELVAKEEREQPTIVELDNLSNLSARPCQYFHKAAYGSPVVPRLRICTPD